ncbi:TonB-dependent receptor domain-containing protein [Sphingomonas sp. BK069]|uniref:TonB-dependent receptor domain-containing protein n=1 Tax=Sphingomonas sp. BK069 TaxID=2586979 RepID=UPI00182A87FC|nr:TonB-dependent receptor [Sphingomonas sp. BK069]MBB3349920.1 outer membrane receptor protein involved in Fe transport [Sphingomonas sp. BK069]
MLHDSLFRRSLAAGGSALALTAIFAMPAFAQSSAPAAAAADAGIDPATTSATATPDQASALDQRDAAGQDVVVTGSRIDRAGYDAPTPTLRVTATDLSVGGRPNVAAALNDLPQFRATTSAQTTGTNTGAGTAPVDLRGLGTSRTLVLLDGRRFASDNDLNTIPTVLIKSVDVVTGGASAAWGSGAVAGVVNVSIDDRFNGLRLGAQAGISSFNDAAERRFEGAFGAAFAGGRGHVLVGGEYLDNDGVVPKVSRPRIGRWATVADGAGRFVLAPDVGFSNAAYGGLIMSGVLAGNAFNPDGTLRRFDGGTVRGTNSIGGEGPSNDDLSPLVTPQRRYNGLARVSYELSDAVKATAEVRHSRMYNNYIWFGDHNRSSATSGLRIGSDNAFLPAAVREQMAAAGQTSFFLGRFNNDFAYSTIDFERETTQATLALDGTIGTRLRWSAYYTHGAFQNNIDTPGFILTQNYARAVDSIVSPTTGQPICRVALTDPGTACVPINLFGEGAPSAAAAAYVTGTPMSRSTTKLDVTGFSLRGEPFALPAGDVSFAAGFEARKEQIDTRVGALDLARAFTSFSFSPLAGAFTVKEAFGELLVPLIHDTPLLRRLELNGAVRVSDYSTTGSIWSYKLGGTNEFFPGLRGRATYSRDIRSASLSELFTQSTVGYNNLTDPQTGQSVYVQNIGGGNVALRPEVANTFTGGVTWSPASVAGLNLTVDYYDIRIDDVITTIAPQDLVTRCFAGNLDLCSRIDRDAAGTLVRTRSTFVNLSQYQTNGIDAELSYLLPLSRLGVDSGGRLRFRLLGTWVDGLSTDDGVSQIEYVRSQGYSFGLGVPKWRVNGAIGYDDKTYSAELRARYISPGEYNLTQDITNGHIGAYTYVDLQLAARIPVTSGPSLEVYANASNLFDKAPPVGSLYSPYYDVIGRYVTVGARVRF